jgi:hypothetical protein
MRASSLSNERVVSLLNRYFVPVYVSNEDYRGDGSAPAAERAEYDRIYREALTGGMSAGTVHAYVVTPDGHPIDSLHVARAAQPKLLIEMLERTVRKMHLREGKPAVAPAVQSTRPKGEPDSLTLHLTARVLRGGAWGEFPAEDWIVLRPEEWKKLLPAGAVAAGRSWDFDRAVAAKVLTHFYPATENNDLTTNRLHEQALKATVLSVHDGVVRARIDGRLKMKHPFYHRDDNNVVEATVVGVLEFEPGKGRIRSLRVVTDKATYGGGTFAVALRSLAE